MAIMKEPGSALPWDHVDVGINKRAVLAGWHAYTRRMSRG